MHDPELEGTRVFDEPDESLRELMRLLREGQGMCSCWWYVNILGLQMTVTKRPINALLKIALILVITL
jgi:hypothetical protein